MDNDLEHEVRRIILEMNSGYNDGWVSNHYRERLKKLKKLIDEALEDKKDAKKR